MARGRKTGGRQKGSRNRATEEARAAARASGVLPLDYMLSAVRDPDADQKRREAMAMAAAPYRHSKLSAIEAKLSPAVAEPSPERTSVVVKFVVPGAGHAWDDQDWTVQIVEDRFGDTRYGGPGQ